MGTSGLITTGRASVVNETGREPRSCFFYEIATFPKNILSVPLILRDQLEILVYAAFLHYHNVSVHTRAC
jgi:hypothetical protein